LDAQKARLGAVVKQLFHAWHFHFLSRLVEFGCVGLSLMRHDFVGKGSQFIVWEVKACD